VLGVLLRVLGVLRLLPPLLLRVLGVPELGRVLRLYVGDWLLRVSGAGRVLRL
jgi:hypothetical protein